MAVGSETKVSNVNVGTIAAATDDEEPVFSAPVDAKILAVYFTNASDVATNGTDYTTIDIQNKGSDGTGTDSLASFGTDSQALSGFDALDLGSLSNNHLSKSDVVSMNKTDTNAGQAIDEASVTIVWEPQSGLDKYDE